MRNISEKKQMMPDPEVFHSSPLKISRDPNSERFQPFLGANFVKLLRRVILNGQKVKTACHPMAAKFSAPKMEFRTKQNNIISYTVSCFSRCMDAIP